MGEEEKLDEIKQILQDACDRDWEDESLFSTASIAANGLYWRGREIERQREQIQVLRKALSAVVTWRDSPEGPEILFPIGAAMIQQVRDALTITDSECR